jgi:predicted transcriptional regulator
METIRNLLDLSDRGETMKGGGRMTTAKTRMVEVIQEQPDDATYDEILRELAFRRMVDRGLEDARAGKTISNEEMAHRIRTWSR